MTDTSTRFYDELLNENIELNKLLKCSQDEKEQRTLEKNLNIVNNLIKFIYKYNASKMVKIEEIPQQNFNDTKNKEKKTKKSL
jgi:hypothetical protein